jgi:hypothetical protein
METNALQTQRRLAEILAGDAGNLPHIVINEDTGQIQLDIRFGNFDGFEHLVRSAYALGWAESEACFASDLGTLDAMTLDPEEYEELKAIAANAPQTEDALLIRKDWALYFAAQMHIKLTGGQPADLVEIANKLATFKQRAEKKPRNEKAANLPDA